MKKAQQYGYESSVVRPSDGRQGQAYVVPREEILYNPAFAEVRRREGLEEGTSGAYKRKSSNCRSSNSVESLQNNSTRNKKKWPQSAARETKKKPIRHNKINYILQMLINFRLRKHLIQMMKLEKLLKTQEKCQIQVIF